MDNAGYRRNMHHPLESQSFPYRSLRSVRKTFEPREIGEAPTSGTAHDPQRQPFIGIGQGFHHAIRLEKAVEIVPPISRRLDRPRFGVVLFGTVDGAGERVWTCF